MRASHLEDVVATVVPKLVLELDSGPLSAAHQYLYGNTHRIGTAEQAPTTGASSLIRTKDNNYAACAADWLRGESVRQLAGESSHTTILSIYLAIMLACRRDCDGRLGRLPHRGLLHQSLRTFVRIGSWLGHSHPFGHGTFGMSLDPGSTKKKRIVDNLVNVELLTSTTNPHRLSQLRIAHTDAHPSHIHC